MQLYAVSPLARSRQVVVDVLALAGIVLFVVLGVLTAAFVRTFADFGKSVENAGLTFHDRLSGAAATLGGVPLVGNAASAPLRSAGGAGTTLAEAGQRQQDLVGHAALLLGLAVALVPIALILRAWLRRRVAFVRRAARANGLAASDAGLELLALDALSLGDRKEVLRISPNPAAAWRNGDALEIRMLAEVALRDAGVLR